MGEDAEKNSHLLATSLRHLRRAVEMCPDSAFFKLNLAHLYAAAGWPEAAMDMVQLALALLESGREDRAEPFSLPFPFGWDEFRVQSSLLYTATRSTPERYDLLRRCLLLYRGGLLLGKLAEEQGRLPVAIVGYRIAVATRPDLGVGHMALARALARAAAEGSAEAGALDEALAHLEAGLRTDPFVTDAWLLFADLLRQRGLEDQARRFLTERLTMLEALSPAGERRVMRDALSEMEEVREALTRRLEPRMVAA
jgi:tetratricopeptide (TPR) repeat protein